MALIPLTQDNLKVRWHCSVLDIEPTSRYGLDHDVTSINSTLCYVAEGSQQQALLLAPNLDEVECNVRASTLEKPSHQESEPIDAGLYASALAGLSTVPHQAQLLKSILDEAASHFVARVPLQPGQQVVRFHSRIPIRDREGSFFMRIAVPMGPAPLLDGVGLSVTVLLPIDTPDYSVEVLDWSREEGIPKAHSRLVTAAQRKALCWEWRSSPYLWIRYRYWDR